MRVKIFVLVFLCNFLAIFLHCPQHDSAAKAADTAQELCNKAKIRDAEDLSS